MTISWWGSSSKFPEDTENSWTAPFSDGLRVCPFSAILPDSAYWAVQIQSRLIGDGLD